MWIEIAVVLAVLWTRWMSPGGANPLTTPVWLSLRPIEVEVAVEQLFVLDALDDAEHTPRQVVVDACHLSGPPDHGDDRERTPGLDVQRVAAVAVWRSEALLGGQHIGAGQVLAQLFGDELRGLRPAGARGDGRADAAEKFAQLESGRVRVVVMP